MTKKVKIDIENAYDLPVYSTEDSAGADLFAANDKHIVILPSERVLIPTGIRVEIPKGYEIQIRPRSGLALKHGVTVLNTPGTIDSDYRGEIGVILINHSSTPFKVRRGDRIAQAVLAKVEQAKWVEAKPSETKRGAGGFGHTG